MFEAFGYFIIGMILGAGGYLIYWFLFDKKDLP